MNEEKTRAETAAAQSGEEACSLQRGPKESVGSGEEITKEMIDAGVNALAELGYPDFWYPQSFIVKCIYLAMLNAHN